MNGLRRALILAMVVLIGSATLAAPDIDPPDAASLFARGQRLLRESNWLAAAAVFEELSGRFPRSKTADLFVFGKAKADYYSGDYAKAVAGFTFYTSRYSTAPEIAFAHYFLANAYYLRGDAMRAVRHWLESVQLSYDSRLDKQLFESLRAAFDNAGTISLGQSELQHLDNDRRCQVIQIAVKALADRGERKQIDRLLVLCDQNITVPTISRTSGNKKHDIEIAIVVPLSGDLHTFGEEVYNGAVIAAELFRQQSSRTIRIVPYDTKGDPIDAGRIVGELVSSSTDAVIGPLTSDEAAVASASIRNSSLPMIAPAASQAGLTRLSESSFQLSPNVEFQGVRMADYAIDELDADSAAVITSTRTDHFRMAQSFIRRFTERGGKIIAVEYYRPRDKDFGPYVADVKAMILGKHPDSMFYIDERGDTLDYDGLPVHVDAIFMPGNPQQVRLLLPQVRFYNVMGTYLGSDSWNDKVIYRLENNVTNGAVFPSPYMSGGRSQSYQTFAAAFDLRYGRRPERLANLAFDAFSLIMNAAGPNWTGRDDLVDALRKVKFFDGASGKITFGPHRENIEMPLYRIERGSPVLIGEQPVENIEPTATDTTQVGQSIEQP